MKSENPRGWKPQAAEVNPPGKEQRNPHLELLMNILGKVLKGNLLVGYGKFLYSTSCSLLCKGSPSQSKEELECLVLVLTKLVGSDQGEENG